MASSADMPSYEWCAPSPPPPWAEVKEEDDQQTKNLKDELARQYKNMLFFWEKYRAQKRYSEELYRFVQQYKRDIALKDKILQEEGNMIEEMQGNISSLEHRLKETSHELEETKKLFKRST